MYTFQSSQLLLLQDCIILERQCLLLFDYLHVLCLRKREQIQLAQLGSAHPSSSQLWSRECGQLCSQEPLGFLHHQRLQSGSSICPKVSWSCGYSKHIGWSLTLNCSLYRHLPDLRPLPQFQCVHSNFPLLWSSVPLFARCNSLLGLSRQYRRLGGSNNVDWFYYSSQARSPRLRCQQVRFLSYWLLDSYFLTVLTWLFLCACALLASLPLPVRTPALLVRASLLWSHLALTTFFRPYFQIESLWGLGLQDMNLGGSPFSP